MNDASAVEESPRTHTPKIAGMRNDPSAKSFIFKTGTAGKGKDSSRDALPSNQYLSFAAGDDSYYVDKDFMIVADGVGSSANANLFSRILADEITKQVQIRGHDSSRVADPKSMLESAYSKTKKEFKDARGYQGSTTVVFTYLDVII